MRRLWLSLSLLGALVAAPRAALAEGSIWQRAREPELRRAAEAVEQIERLMAMGEESDSPQAGRDFALAAVAAGELAGASRLPGARLRCVFGRALLEAGNYRRAAEVLSRAVDELVPGPLAASCYSTYGLALAYLGETKREIEAFTRALAFAERRIQRAHLLYNRADARMAEGQLAAAIEDYRSAIAIGQQPETTALAYYGLAVALDRYGDLPAAWQALEAAHRITSPFSGLPGIDLLDAPGVFFVPDYDKHYYRGLSHMAAARSAATDEERRNHLERALVHWGAFLDAGEKAQDRYLENARLHELMCRRELEKLAQVKRPPRAGSGSRPPRPRRPRRQGADSARDRARRTRRSRRAP